MAGLLACMLLLVLTARLCSTENGIYNCNGNLLLLNKQSTVMTRAAQVQRNLSLTEGV